MFNETKTKATFKTLDNISRLELLLDIAPNSNQVILHYLTNLAREIRYCSYHSDLHLRLRSVVLRSIPVIKSSILAEGDVGVSSICILLNAIQEYELALELFKQHAYLDPNPHSQYKRTFAESVLGANVKICDPKVGIQFPQNDTFSSKNEVVNPTSYQHLTAFSTFKNSIEPTLLNDKNIFLLSMDARYFKLFGLAQCASILKHFSPHSNYLLVAIFDYDKSVETDLISLTTAFNTHGFNLSIFRAELPTFPNNLDRSTYLASIRFQLVSVLLTGSNHLKSVTVTDADIIFLREFNEADVSSDQREHFDVEYFDDSSVFPYISLYAKIGAAYVKFWNTPRTLRVSNLLSKFLHYNLSNRSCWTLDQFALAFCLHLSPDIRPRILNFRSISSEWDAPLQNMAGPTKFTDQRYLREIGLLQKWLGEFEQVG
jgi:hypothetical protein